MLTLNERVRFRGELCQVVAITPAGGNTMYKLKHVQTDKVMDGDFIEDDLERVDPLEAAEEQQQFLAAAKEQIDEKFGADELSPGEIRDRKLELLKGSELGAKPPVREEQPVDGTLRAPLAPSVNDDDAVTVLGEDVVNDYSNPDGSTTEVGDAAERAEANRTTES